MIKSVIKKILLTIVKIILNMMDTKRHLIDYISGDKDIYRNFYDEIKRRTYSSYNKIIFINPNNYPMPELEKLKTYIPNLEYIDISDDITSIHNLPIKTLLKLIEAPVIVSTQESRALNMIGDIENQKLIYLWHACGAFKKFGNIDPNYHTYRLADYVIVSAEGIRQNYSNNLGVPIENVVALGTPRTEVFFDDQYISYKKEEFHTKYPHLKNKKIYLYVPTYEIRPFRSMTGFNFQEFSNLLSDDEVLIYKLHPGIVIALNKGMTTEYCDFRNVNDNIFDLSSENIETLLINSNVILTDYSSTFIDAMLIDKPVVFVAPENLENHEKGFYIDYKKDLPGEIVYDGEATTVLNALRNATINHPNYQKFKEFHLGACKGNITKRVADFINEVYNEKS